MCLVNTKIVEDSKKKNSSDTLYQMSDEELVSTMNSEYEIVKHMHCKQCAIPLFYIQFAYKYMDFLQQAPGFQSYFTYLKSIAQQFIHNIYDQNLTSDKCQCGFAHYRVPTTSQSGHNFILSQLRKIHCKYNPVDNDA